jgi:hypothetical protein
MKFLAKLEKNPTECFQLLKELHGDNVMSSTRVLEWHKRCMECRGTVKEMMIVFFNIRGAVMVSVGTWRS